MTAATKETAILRRAPSPGRRRIGRPSDRLLFGVLGFVGILVVWELAADVGMFKKSLMSAPSLIWKAGVTDFTSGALWPHIGTSMSEWLVGFAIAAIVGIPLGLAIGWFRHLDYLASVLLSALYATPKVALVPMIILVAGIGLEAKVIVVLLLSIFAIIVSTVAGVHSVDKRHQDIARSFGASQSLIFRSVVLPSTIPFILSGLRIGVGRALVGVVVAEFLVANQGLGWYISFNGTMLNSSRVYLGILLLGGFGIALGEFIRLFEKRFDVWRPEIN
jgi:ABC-type nitrate/sulfonate/bicarbonate transport system, permease component